MLTNTAFNAMLKTLEEPPEYLFKFARTDPQKVPVTVLSSPACGIQPAADGARETVLDHPQPMCWRPRVAPTRGPAPAGARRARLHARR